MLPELPAANTTATATPSTSAWLFLAGMLTCLLVVGHQLPFAQADLKPTQRAAARPAPQPAAAPALARQYAATRAALAPTAAL